MKLNKAFLSIAALALLALSGLFAGVAGAAAPEQSDKPGGGTAGDIPPDRVVRFVGRVDAVTDRGLVMTTRRGEIRVLVGERTRITVQRDGECVTGTLRAIQIGQPATVVGVTTDERGVVAGRGITQCRRDGDAKAEGQTDESAPDRRVRIHGRVDSVSANGLVLTTRRGEVQVRVGERTRIMVAATDDCVEGTLADIQVGQPATVVGRTTNERGVIAARGIAQCRGGNSDTEQ